MPMSSNLRSVCLLLSFLLLSAAACTASPRIAISPDPEESTSTVGPPGGALPGGALSGGALSGGALPDSALY